MRSGPFIEDSIRTRTGLSVALMIWRAQRGLAGEHDRPLLVRVVRVVRPELVAGLDLGHARADQEAADVVADERLLDEPALAVPRLVPLVREEVEDLHSTRPS